jgi:hypothetical protein
MIFLTKREKGKKRHTHRYTQNSKEKGKNTPTHTHSTQFVAPLGRKEGRKEGREESGSSPSLPFARVNQQPTSAP